jgi:hypothetical protein
MVPFGCHKRSFLAGKFPVILERRAHEPPALLRPREAAKLKPVGSMRVFGPFEEQVLIQVASEPVAVLGGPSQPESQCSLILSAACYP